VFVLDGDRKIAYVGAVDDNVQPDKVKSLASAMPSTPCWPARAAQEVTKQFGCGIQYK